MLVSLFMNIDWLLNLDKNERKKPINSIDHNFFMYFNQYFQNQSKNIPFSLTNDLEIIIVKCLEILYELITKQNEQLWYW